MCLPCGNSTTGLDGSTGECGCPAVFANMSYRLTEFDSAGLPLASKECSLCPSGSRAFHRATGGRWADPYVCQSCTDPNSVLAVDGSCTCRAGFRSAGLSSLQPRGTITCLPLAQAAVLATYTESSAQVVAFHSLQTEVGRAATGTLTGLRSAYHEHMYAAAAVGCRAYRVGSDPAPCHALAHLCALNMWFRRAPACQLYIDTAAGAGRDVARNGFGGWPAYLPQLYWRGDFPSITADTSLVQEMAFKDGTQANSALRLEFYLAAYALNGTFLGLQPLRNQLAYCGSGGDRLTSDPIWLEYGYSWAATYTCDVRVLARAGEPVFYDLYVRDLAADGVSSSSGSQRDGTRVTGPAAQGLADIPLRLYPVPVRVVNYRDEGGNRPNVNRGGTGDEGNDVLTGRFMLYDAVTGVTTVGEVPEVVRYASKLTLTIRTQGAARPARIRPPVLTIEYTERPTAPMFDASVKYPPMARDKLTMAVEYEGDYSSYQNSIIGLGAALGVLVLLWATMKTSAWLRMNARSQFEAQLGSTHVSMWALLLVITFAASFFWYLWVVCAYWLAYFKLQDSVYALVPVHRPGTSDDPYISFTAGLLLIFMCYSARIAWLIYKQVTVDIFLLDWEKPRGSMFKMGQDLDAQAASQAAMMAKEGGPGAGGGSSSSASSSSYKLTPISAWRTIFAANEWAELSTQRRTDLAFTLAILVLILEGAGMKYIATPQPDARDLNPGPINPALQFANTVFWYAIIISCQVFFGWLIGERYIVENPSTRFLDLCTVMKVSVLLMDQRYRGFYLHANAPHEHADGNMEEVACRLYEEASGLRVGRGLPGCPDPSCQTFEVHVPALWRENYDRVFRRLLDAETSSVDAMAATAAAAQQQGGGMTLPGYGASAPYPGAAGTSIPAGLGTAGPVGALARFRERTRRLGAAQAALSTFLHGFITETDPDYKRVWRERTLLQSAFDFPPDMINDGGMMSSGAGMGLNMGAGGGMGMSAGGGAGAGGGGGGSGGGGSSRLTYMYCDHSYRWERLIFRGIEVDLAVWDALLFCLVDWAMGSSPTSAALTTYILSMAVAWARRELGQRNVSYKTLVDDRFLT